MGADEEFPGMLESVCSAGEQTAGNELLEVLGQR